MNAMLPGFDSRIASLAANRHEWTGQAMAG
jgi:hypothetical protein